ncbi:LuxR C-terminal-related transcriptional regulator, partial [Nocardioides sp.]|uniref:LuxR C-terminal-related transcriptional regulator n=1 Tax=Nocardioides sp. TaxID=35761 RepID=UPI002ED6B93B
ASALLGLASLTRGDLDAAHHAYSTAVESLQREGHVADVLGCSITLGDIELTQGKLREAQRTYQRALDLAAADSAPPRGAADMYVGLSRVALERGDLAGAAAYLREADQLGEAGGLPQNPYRWRVAMALLRQAEGDPAAAIGLLQEAEEVYVADFNPEVAPVAATRTRVMAARGDVAAGRAWARSRGLTPRDELSYDREYEHVTLARVLLADHAASKSTTALAEAADLIDRLLAAAEAGGRTGVVIELLVLQAQAREASGRREQALASWDRAVRLAEPEGYVLDPLDDSAAPAPAAQDLVDPLSSRELDVLRYLGSDLDGPAIARELGVSLSTVRTHTQHIYAKLGVNSRRAAVRSAHQLNLFSRGNRQSTHHR